MMLFAVTVSAQEKTKHEETEIWQPVPKIVTPGVTAIAAPSDAIILFGGTDASAWKGKDGGAVKWKIADGAITIDPAVGDITTKQSFGDCQLHIEWRTPAEPKGNSQERGNSGVFLMSRYELQVLDSYNNPTYVNGQAGSIYKQLIPLVNVCRPPGQWQTYDVVFTAPRFNADGTVKTPADITVLQNGILVQNHGIILGSTTFVGKPQYKKHNAEEPLLLQCHNNAVSYRNIWIRKL